GRPAHDFAIGSHRSRRCTGVRWHRRRWPPGCLTGSGSAPLPRCRAAAVAGAPAPTDPQIYAIAMWNPSAIFFLPGTQGMGVVDSNYSRILIFDPYEKWPDPATAT